MSRALRSHRSHHNRTRTSVRGAAILCLATLSLGPAVLAAPAAVAAELTSTVTSAPLGSTTFWAWEAVRLDVAWAVPDAARAGNTFTISLPDELRPFSAVGFDLLCSARTTRRPRSRRADSRRSG